MIEPRLKGLRYVGGTRNCQNYAVKIGPHTSLCVTAWANGDSSYTLISHGESILHVRITK